MARWGFSLIEGSLKYPLFLSSLLLRLPVLFLFSFPSCFKSPKMKNVKLAALPSHEAMCGESLKGLTGHQAPEVERGAVLKGFSVS